MSAPLQCSAVLRSLEKSFGLTELILISLCNESNNNNDVPSTHPTDSLSVCISFAHCCKFKVKVKVVKVSTSIFFDVFEWANPH